MRRSLFLRIEEAVAIHDYYFTQRTDVVGVPGLSSLQTMTAALRMLAYGTTADVVDDYVRIGDNTTIESLRRFLKSIMEIFEVEYLRRPNEQDVSKLLAENEQRGFPGMLGSINCMHWKWKNYLTTWQDLAEGHGPEVKYTINENEYNMGYYLADGIYLSWPTFVKTIPKPQGNKRKYFAATHESIRKDVERAFGVLQSRFAMICGPSRFWDVETMKYIMTTCVILHNMIIDDERESSLEEEHFDSDVEIPVVTRIRNHPNNLREYIQMHQQIRNKPAYFQL
ncbi:uncharacterized protein LOC141704879 [Apium graveolens]|uniref:uncharacterized protein LOC141703423 n=1 Tax=Apium graveolens TaxID=4045 RepID=UPI003D7C0908